MPARHSIHAFFRNPHTVKRGLLLLGSACLLATTAGCVVAPAPHGRVVMAPEPIYVAPGYASPGAGYGWENHPRHGWGWRHPDRGWHRGWQ